MFLIYFGLKLFTIKNYDTFYKTISPVSILVTIQYFRLIYPKNTEKIYKFTYTNFVSHILNIILLLIELQNIENYKFKDCFKYLSLIIFFIASICINYYFRKVWSYNF